MGQRRYVTLRAVLRFLPVLAVILVLAGCGADDPQSTPADPAQFKGAPAPIAALHAQQSELLDGGADAFKAQLEKLKGHPVVVNKWASWCGPCRAEFPDFQQSSVKHGKAVAFLGVNTNDNHGEALGFLKRYPVSYPSYEDPSGEIAQVFNGAAAFPTTAFYDSEGKLAYVHQGQYLTGAKLEQDIRRYALR